jgi:hypothetical protein
MKIFIDSNIILHFTAVENISWKEVLHEESAPTLVFPLAVISEMDKHKRNPKFRDRAITFLKKIEAADKTAQLKADLKIEIIKSTIKEKTLQENDLVRGEKDDLIIACIIEYRLKNAEEKILLLTDDSSLRLRASAWGIECIELPSKYELKEDDDQAKEIRKLKSELQKVQSAIPKLRLVFNEGGQNTLLQLMEPFFESYKLTELRNIKSSHSIMYKEYLSQYRDQFFLPELAEVDINIYNDRLKQFYLDYEKYLNKCEPIFLEQRLTFSINLKLVNCGTSPATNIDVELTFPPGLLVRIKPEFDYPESPEPPSIYTTRQFARANQYPYPFAKDVYMGPCFLKKVEDHYIGKVAMTSLKHNQEFIIDPFWYTSRDYRSLQGFQIEAKIYADNIPTIIHEKLNIQIQKVDLSE